MARDERRSMTEEASALGQSLTIKGRIHGQGDLIIDGSVEGEVSIDGTLQIGAEAKVQATVSAASALVEGTLDGDVTCSGPVKVGAEGVLMGNVNASSFAMEEGARVAATITADFDLPPELTQRSR